MSEPTIICPSCRTEIKLTESLAAPLLESTRRDYEKRLALKDADVAKREAGLRDREESINRAQERLDEQVAEKVRLERGRISAEVAAKAKLAFQSDLEQKTKELADLNELMKDREAKLAEAQRAQAEVLRKQRELDDARRELDLTVEKRIQEGLAATREQARKEGSRGKPQAQGVGERADHRIDAETD